MAHTLAALVPIGAVLLLLLARRFGRGVGYRRGAARRGATPLDGPFLPGGATATATPLFLGTLGGGGGDGGSCGGSPADGGSSGTSC